MGKVYDDISPELAAWLGQQRMFFVASAPLDAGGFVNCSPKGLDSFRILGPREVAYLDLTGSGVETIAHLRENGRIVFMFCAFDGSPKIVRLHGIARVAEAGTAEHEELRSHFGDHPGIRAIIRASVTRVSDSCGYAVPRYEFTSERDTLTRWAEAKGEAGLEHYRRKKNVLSIDGLPGLKLSSSVTT